MMRWFKKTKEEKVAVNKKRSAVNDALLDYVSGGFDFDNLSAEDREKCTALFGRYQQAARDEQKGKIDRAAYNTVYNEWMSFIVGMDIKYRA